MSKIPSDEILESLYNLRIREFAQLKTVLELYDMEIHLKMSVPNYQKLKTMVKCKAGDKCLIPHHKVDAQPNTKPNKGNHSPKQKRKRRQERCGCCENCITFGLRLARLGSIGFLKWNTVPEKPDAESLGTDLKKTIHKVYATSCDYPGKERTIVGKINCPHQRSPYAVKFEDRSHEETERLQRCARSNAWNLAKKIYKLKEKDKTTFDLPAEEWVLPAASTKEPEEESLWWIQERVCIWSVGKTLTLLSWRPWGHRDGDDGQRRGANKRRSHGICQRSGLIRDGYASWRNSRSAFSREALRGSWVYLSPDQRSKITSHQKWQENWLQFFKLCTIYGSWNISEFFFNYTVTYFSIIFITGFRIWCQQIHRKSSTRRKWKYEWRASGRLVARNHRNRKAK